MTQIDAHHTKVHTQQDVLKTKTRGRSNKFTTPCLAATERDAPAQAKADIASVHKTGDMFFFIVVLHCGGSKSLCYKYVPAATYILVCRVYCVHV